MSSSSLCVSCSMQFTLFKRKNRCPACKLLYCSSCFKKGEGLPRRNAKQCLRCHALSAKPFVRSELMLLSVKELKTFLDQKNVSSVGCTEKGDLVDVIISHESRPRAQTSRMSEQHTHPTQTNEPDNQPSTSSSTTSSQSQSNTRSAPQGINNFFGGLHINPEIHDFVQNMFRMDESGFDGLRPPSLETNTNQSNVQENYNFYQQNNPHFQDDFTPSCVHPTQVKTQSKISLESLKDEGDIRKLSTKELKVLLEDNFVDYKGCIEKEELIQRLLILWQSKQFKQNASATNSNESSVTREENEVCKVCMDKIIDCVFLECGHLVTCVDCGRQLRECPLCRQNIVRIVRVFKS